MKNIKKSITNFSVLLFIFTVWQFGSLALNKPLFLPSPLQTFNVIADLFTSGSLWQHMGATFYRVTLAILITFSISVPLGICIVSYKPINTLFEPILEFLRFVPVTVFTSILILLIGIDEPMKITFLVIATLFSFLPTIIQICLEMDDKIKETAYTIGFSYNRCIFHIILPYIIPSILKSTVTLYGVGWTFVIIAEITNTQYGLGHLMYIGSARGRTDVVLAAIIIVAIISFIFDKIANYLINKNFSWRYGNE